MARLSDAVRQTFLEELRELKTQVTERDAEIESLRAQLTRALARLEFVRKVLQEDQ